MSPEEVIEAVRTSGLRGCGGAGFPVAEKWQACLEASEQDKRVVCNGAEGDPKTFKDRMLLESDPHAVLEGILICAYAVGARRGYIYVNPRYELAVSHLQIALKQLETQQLTGKNILGSDFNFQFEIMPGGEGLMSGEESALLNHLPGEPLMACARPPFPADNGMEGTPTVVNNVETMACVSAILAKGAEWYAGLGSGAGKGTKVLSLEGHVVNWGVLEVPLGTTVRQIVHDMGGVPENAPEIKAVQVGGSAGGWIKPEELETAIDYDELKAAGTMMGSGSVWAAASNSCAVDLALESLALIRSEACGRCVFGREGTRQMAEILSDIASGKGRQDDIDLLLDLGEGMKLGSLCGLGKAAPNPVLSTIRHFRTEYKAHIKEKTCPSQVCSPLSA
jgi:NADH:ubiquinone oxidoreductase subunit F (NADH-binding)